MDEDEARKRRAFSALVDGANAALGAIRAKDLDESDQILALALALATACGHAAADSGRLAEEGEVWFDNSANAARPYVGKGHAHLLQLRCAEREKDEFRKHGGREQ